MIYDRTSNMKNTRGDTNGDGTTYPFTSTRVHTLCFSGVAQSILCSVFLTIVYREISSISTIHKKKRLDSDGQQFPQYQQNE